MDQGVKPEAAPPLLHFVKDLASESDEFGSHSRIATAISTVIQTRDDLKVIGLLGPWGSGKSTILKLVEAQLENASSQVESYCFQYDAWLHQNDPPRRSFLETLIYYLIAKKLPSADAANRWKQRLDQLNRRVEESEVQTTPTLTTSGRIILWSLFALPLAGQFLSYSWFKSSADITATAFEQWAFWVAISFLFLPLLLASSIYLSWRPAKWPWRADFWRTHRTPFQGESILSLVTNKQVQTVRNRITRDPEPTTIEFQDFFREVMAAASAPNRRFIFIVDNLDRLPEAEAVAMWGTIRSFFLGAEETQNVRRVASLPTVILPVDEDAVRRMYKASHSDDADVLAKSFMDKTFDLTFRVTRPVLSDWHSYMSKQMRVVFGQHFSPDWPYIAGTIFEAFLLSDKNAVVTPRTINTLINSMAVLWLQWRSESINFASFAYYAIYREIIDRDIVAAIAAPQARIENFDSNWQQSISGLHYGIPPSEALQVLIEQPLLRAINQRELDEFKRLASVSGFERVLFRVLDSAASRNEIDPAFVFNTALLMKAVELADNYFKTHAWRRLLFALGRTSNWSTLDPNDVAALAELQSHTETPQNFIETVVAKLKTVSTFNASSTLKSFLEISQGLLDFASNKEIPVPRIVVHGNADAYLLVVSQAPSVKLIAQLDTELSDRDLVGKLSSGLTEPSETLFVELWFRALHARNEKMPWDTLISAAANIVETQRASSAAMPAALACLGILRNSDASADTQLQRLNKQGYLTTIAGEAHSSSRLDVEARACALTILSDSSFEAPNGLPWQQALNERPGLARLIDDALSEFDPAKTFDYFLEMIAANSTAKALVRTVGTARVQEERIGLLYIDDVIERLPMYLDCIEEESRDNFISQLADYDTFWDELAKPPLNQNVTSILHSLLKYEERKAAVIDFINRGLDAVSSDEWASAVRSSSEPYPVAVAASSSPSMKLITSNLFEALQSIIPDILTNSDIELRSRWFKAAMLISPSARKTLFSNVQDRITSGVQVPSMSELLTLGGSVLLDADGFDDKQDGAVRHVVLPLLSSSEGIDWLLNNVQRAKQWVDESKDTTQEFLSARLADLWRASDEIGKDRLENLQTAWSLPEVSNTQDEPAEDTGSSTEAKPRSKDRK